MLGSGRSPPILAECMSTDVLVAGDCMKQCMEVSAWVEPHEAAHAVPCASASDEPCMSPTRGRGKINDRSQCPLRLSVRVVNCSET